MLVSVVMATAGVLMYGYQMIPESKSEWIFDIATGVVFFLGAGLHKWSGLVDKPQKEHIEV